MSIKYLHTNSSSKEEEEEVFIFLHEFLLMFSLISSRVARLMSLTLTLALWSTSTLFRIILALMSRMTIKDLVVDYVELVVVFCV